MKHTLACWYRSMYMLPRWMVKGDCAGDLRYGLVGDCAGDLRYGLERSVIIRIEIIWMGFI